MLLNANQRFIDVYNEFVPLLENTKLTLKQIKKIHKRLEKEKVIIANPKEEAIGSFRSSKRDCASGRLKTWPGQERD